MEIFIINLKGAEERRHRLLAQFDGQTFQPTFVDAINGRATAFERDAYLINLRDQNDNLKNTEIACALSHLKVWKRFLETSAPHCLVLEDDVDINFPALERLGSQLHGAPKNWDLIHVNDRPLKHLSRWEAMCFHARRKAQVYEYTKIRKAIGRIYRKRILKNIMRKETWPAPWAPVSDIMHKRFEENYYKWVFQSTGTAGYVLSRDGASKLIHLFKHIGIPAPIDCVIEFAALPINSRNLICKWHWEDQPKYLRDLNRIYKSKEDSGSLPQLISFIYHPERIVRLNELSRQSTID